MDTQTARSIIREAREGGFEDRLIPDDESELFQIANEWVEEAQKYYQRGDKHPTVVAIVQLADEAQLEQGNTVVADKEVEEPNPALTAVEKTYPRRSSGGFSESDIREVEAYENANKFHGLPIPYDVDATVHMPSDISTIGDKEVRRLSSYFQAYLNRARWLHATATTQLQHAEHLYNNFYRKAYKVAYREIKQRDERPTKDIVDAIALEDDSVIEWSKKIDDHSEEVVKLKALIDIYGGNVERLSREATLRQYEWERSK